MPQARISWNIIHTLHPFNGGIFNETVSPCCSIPCSDRTFRFFPRIIVTKIRRKGRIFGMRCSQSWFEMWSFNRAQQQLTSRCWYLPSTSTCVCLGLQKNGKSRRKQQRVSSVTFPGPLTLCYNGIEWKKVCVSSSYMRYDWQSGCSTDQLCSINMVFIVETFLRLPMGVEHFVMLIITSITICFLLPIIDHSRVDSNTSRHLHKLIPATPGAPKGKSWGFKFQSKTIQIWILVVEQQ